MWLIGRLGVVRLDVGRLRVVRLRVRGLGIVKLEDSGGKNGSRKGDGSKGKAV